jgi:Conserved region of unknown function on GLTSCR protein
MPSTVPAATIPQPAVMLAAAQPVPNMPQIVEEPDNMLASPLLNIKKPAEVYTIPINKQKKIAWVESQVKKDQHEAINPNFRAPFKSKEDACKRLLRYHVFDELDTSPWDLERSDEMFEIKSSILLSRYVSFSAKYTLLTGPVNTSCDSCTSLLFFRRASLFWRDVHILQINPTFILLLLFSRYHSMLAKYHLLLQQESTRQASSSEEVMLARFWDSEERQNLAKEKEDFQKGVVHELPPLSEEWAAKYEEIYDSKPPPGVVGETVKVEEDEKPEGVKQEDPFTVTDEVKPVVVEATTGTKRPLQQDDVIAKIEEEVFFVLIAAIPFSYKPFLVC